MRYRVTTNSYEFSPSEVAIVTGVSTALQRDWRRRGLITNKQSNGWNKYTLEEVIQMAVMRAFTQSGITTETAKSVASQAVLPVLSELSRWDDVAVFSGDSLDSDQMDRIRAGAVRGVSGEDQFTFLALPDQGDEVGAARLRNLADGEQVLNASGNFYGIVLDHSALAHKIAHLANLPLIRFEVEVLGGEDK